jgi:hypothetical protein
MTQPEAVPQLSDAVVDTTVDSTVTRIGVVSAVVETDNITVAISGSSVLIQAAYLFPQYQPLLGDRVVVQRQGAAWFVLGTLSGPINTLLLNPSFEEGVLGATPPNWSISVVSSGAGTPTLTKVLGGEVAGSHSADFGTDSVATGGSEANVFSDPVACAPGSRWTAALFVSTLTNPAPADFSILDLYIRFLDSGGAFISEFLVEGTSFSVDIVQPIYFRLSPATIAAGYVVAPVNAAFVQMRLRGRFFLTGVSFFSFFLDYMILRQV